MNEPTMEILVRRLDRVERENRRLKRVGVVALAVIATVILVAMATPPPKLTKVVEAEKFVLKDIHRKVRAELGQIRFSFGWDPGLTFYDCEDNEVAQLAANQDDALLLLGSDSEEHKRGAGMMVTTSETKLILFYKNDAADLILRPDRGVVLRLGGEKMLDEGYEEARAKLALQAEDSSRLTLSNKAGKVIWSAP